MSENDRKICDTSVTIDLVQEVIATKVGVPDAKITNWTAVDIALGKGFLSVMAKMELTWTSDDAKLPSNVMCKIPTTGKLKYLTQMNPEFAKMVEGLRTKIHLVHNAEVSCYEVFGKMGDKTPVKIPVIYGLKKLKEGGELIDPAYIVMEDMSGVAGLRNMLAMETLSDDQTKEVITQLAQLHAWSLSNKQHLNDIETMDIMSVFAEQYDQMTDSTDKFQAMLAMPDWKAVINDELAAKVPRLKLKKETLMSLASLHRDYGLPDVLVHGDIHTNNMMFFVDDEGTASGKLKALIDFQIIHLGSPCEDVARLVAMCVDRANRTPEYSRKMVDYYCDQFAANMPDSKLPFDREKYFEAFTRSSIIMGASFVPMMPGMIMMIKSGALPGVDADKVVPIMMQDVKVMLSDMTDLMDKLNIQ